MARKLPQKFHTETEGVMWGAGISGRASTGCIRMTSVAEFRNFFHQENFHLVHIYFSLSANWTCNSCCRQDTLALNAPVLVNYSPRITPDPLSHIAHALVLVNYRLLRYTWPAKSCCSHITIHTIAVCCAICPNCRFIIVRHQPPIEAKAEHLAHWATSAQVGGAHRVRLLVPNQ